MRAVGYTRVSTYLQAKHGGGLATQVDALERWADDQGAELVMVESDEGESGKNGLDTRIGLARAVAMLEEGAADVLVVDYMDRLARDLLMQETMVMRLRSVGVEVVSVKEPAIDGDEGLRDLVRQILGAIAQYERTKIRGKMLAGARRKAAEGGYAFGRPPYGWRAENMELVAVADQQLVIADIRKMRGSGLTLRAIAERLNADGVPGPTGGVWRGETVRRVLAERKAVPA